ncbi:MAG: NAD(P)H-dependent oxidoreductase [Fimbriimonadaceae bacterium]|nr:NAD(P)H-dependent oxidoreductase [Chitinophagales bacterium]
MITIISATNRKDSNTLKIAYEYKRLLDEKNIENKVLSLQNLPKNLFTDMMYDEDCAEFTELQAEYFYPAEKFIFITPEYNGSIPGILKVLLDASDMKKSFFYKKALLVGTATGRAGNLRGLDHLTAILNNMRVNVHWNKLPISKIDLELNESGIFHNEDTLKVISKQLDDFIAF